jgi:hypothetical protein
MRRHRRGRHAHVRPLQGRAPLGGVLLVSEAAVGQIDQGGGARRCYGPQQRKPQPGLPLPRAV